MVDVVAIAVGVATGAIRGVIVGTADVVAVADSLHTHRTRLDGSMDREVD